jgi:two-component system sensor histidine kinase/response regulator
LVLIQDNEQMAWEICDLLTAAGYQAIWLLDGSTVTQQIEVLRPLAIITETQLPDMRVQELITILRNSTTTYKIKVLAIADASEQQELSQDPLTEPDVYLNKPLQLEELLQTLSRILSPK